MRRLLVLALLATLALGAKPGTTPLTIDIEARQRDRVVEQQSPGGAFCDPSVEDCVVNPTNCKWDPDEWIRFSGIGDLDPGESASFELCVVADWVSHLWYVGAWASGKHAALQLTLEHRNPHKPTGVTINAVDDGQKGKPRISARGCLVTAGYDRETFWPLDVIGGSNGGVGAYTPLVLTVTNTGDRVAKDVSVRGQLDWLHTSSLTEYYCGRITYDGWRQPGFDPITGVGVGWGVAG